MSADPVLGELLSDTRAIVQELLEAPPMPRESLVRALEDAAERHLQAARRPIPTLDIELAEVLSTRLAEMLARWDTLDPRGRKLVQAAVLYFALEDDGAEDLASVFGFDDDAEVVDAVSRALGMPPLEIDRKPGSL